jgi:hypothetical protein
MRWVRRFVVMSVVFVALLTSAAAATAKSPAFKAGTYKLKPAGYTVTLKHARCGGKLQFCVALPKSPAIVCVGGPSETVPVGNFATPGALSGSGKVTEHAPISWDPLGPGTPAATGESAFSVVFKHNGTAQGYVEVSLTYPLLGEQSTPFKCSGKVSFTAKLA